MDITLSFFCATVGILLGVLSVGLPCLGVVVLAKKLWKRAKIDYEDEMSFKNLQVDQISDMLDEYVDHLTTKQEYETVSILARIRKEFKERKISIQDVYRELEVIDYTQPLDDSELFPERKAIVVDTFTSNGSELAIKVFFELRKPETVREKIKSFIFN